MKKQSPAINYTRGATAFPTPLNVGDQDTFHFKDHVMIDDKPYTVVAQRYGRIYYVAGHLDVFAGDIEAFALRAKHVEGQVRERQERP